MSEGTAEATETKPGRGRPRPGSTIERDNKVLGHLRANGPKSRKELASELDLPGNEIYLSLYRLSRNEPADVVKNGSQWSAVTETTSPVVE
jgi:hypothetical protein